MISGLRDTAGRNLALLWVTMLINIIGSNMLLVYISPWVLSTLGVSRVTLPATALVEWTSVTATGHMTTQRSS
jgi:hypothetical protein